MRTMNEMSAGQTTCATFWVKGIAETLEAAGLDIPALFEEAELELAALSDADARFPTEGISRLWQLAARRSGNPAIGLTNSSAVKPGSFDVVAYAMMSSPNLLGILERAARYVDILSDAATLTIADDREGHRLVLELFGGKYPVPRQRFSYYLMSILSFCRWVTNRDLRPLAFELRFPPPADLQSYQDAFKCPLRFNAPVNALLFAPTDVTLSLPGLFLRPRHLGLLGRLRRLGFRLRRLQQRGRRRLGFGQFGRLWGRRRRLCRRRRNRCRNWR